MVKLMIIKCSNKDKSVLTPGGFRKKHYVFSVDRGQTVTQTTSGDYTVADKIVLTPGGPRSQSLVHLIDPGFGLILHQGVIKKLDLLTNYALDIQPAFAGAIAPAGNPQDADLSISATLPALGEGWITYAWWDSNNTAISDFTARWIVPQEPRTKNGQTVFLFNGIQNTGDNHGILQPVLQYGSSAAGGGDYWTIASWYVTSGGQAFHTNLIRVNPGQSLIGLMSNIGDSGDSYNYTSKFSGYDQTNLVIQGIRPLHWANITLEAYAIQQCSDYPASDTTHFQDIAIDIQGTKPRVAWLPANRVQDCGQQTNVESNNNPGGAIIIRHR